MDPELRQELNKLLNTLPLKDNEKAKIRKKFKKMDGFAAALLFNDLRIRAEAFSFALETIRRYTPFPKK